ncbi:hypothetical protein ACFVAV_22530 [Nocardia sp. NPDC057663]|uniref:hypothetical protein n=1 Tax=Nocardia sp. NPDC057663 TaxID=3346201 RepID=UPI0036724AE7
MTNDGWEEIAPHQIRKEIDKPIYVVVTELVEQRGFRIRRQGHKIALYCPCGPDGRFITIGGTVRDADAAAKRIKRAAKRCPDQHDLMR